MWQLVSECLLRYSMFWLFVALQYVLVWYSSKRGSKSSVRGSVLQRGVYQRKGLSNLVLQCVALCCSVVWSTGTRIQEFNVVVCFKVVFISKVMQELGVAVCGSVSQCVEHQSRA